LDTHWKKRFKALGPVADRAARALFVGALLALTFGPLPMQPGSTPTASADLLKWDDMHTPYADLLDTTGARTALPAFGTVAALSTGAVAQSHTVVTGANGDLFAVGKPATGTAPNVYKSTDNGLTWTASNNTQGGNLFPAGSRIVGVAVAPKYPQDNRVYAAFTDDVAAADATDGLAVSTNGGNTFVIIADFTAATAAKAQLAGGGATFGVTSIAISPDFDGSTAAGEVVVGLSNTAAVVRAERLTGAGLFSGTAAPTVLAGGIVVASTTTGNILSLAYSPGEVTRLAALVSDTGAGTRVLQRAAAGAWEAVSAANLLSATIAVAGGVSFADTYTTGGTYYAAWTDTVAAAPAAAAGVYKFDGTVWSLQAGTGAPGSTAALLASITGIAVRGSGTTTNVFAVEGGTSGTRIFKSTNAGSTFTNRNYSGQDAVTSITAAAGVQARVAVPMDYATSGRVYVTSSGTGGGVIASTNSGQNWMGTGLTNALATITALSVASGETSFALAGAMVFKTTNTTASTAGYRMVQRASATDTIGTIVIPTGFATSGVVFLRVTSTGGIPLKSTDAGETFGTSGSSAPDPNTVMTTLSCASATQCWAGMADGKVFITSNGLSSWDAGRIPVAGATNVRVFTRPANFATSNIIFAQADVSGSTEIIKSADGGVTWTQVGSSSGKWGSGTGTGSFSVSPSYATDQMLFYRPPVPAGAIKLYRFKDIAAPTGWEEIGSTSSAWGTIRTSAAAGIGDGVRLQALDTAAAQNNILVTYFPNTVNSGNWTKLTMRNADLDVTPPAPAFAPTTFSTTGVSSGTLIYAIAGGRMMQWTETTGFLTSPTLISPLNNSNVPANTGNDGIPLTMTWNAVDRAQCYDVQIAIDAAFGVPILDGTAGAGACAAGADGSVANPAIIVTGGAGGIASLSPGTSFYWRIRVRNVGPSIAAGDLTAPSPGPWSVGSRFSVSTQSTTVVAPQPSLPQDGAQLPSLSTGLSWNNPPGVTQVQVQVTPLNGDGPAINLILGSAVSGYEVPAPLFGTGPYVVLPGASYTWRVRTTSATTSIGETDQSWGPWSIPRVFTTALPNAGTIQLLGPINGESITDTTPTLQWKDANSAMFYYEVQLSADPNFGASGVVAAVYWNLLHAGQSTPPSSWTVPDAFKVAVGTYYWRVRQRLQATPKGSAETGIAWSPTQSFSVK